MLTGNHIGLRAIEPDDLPRLQTWRNNVEMRKYYREYRELNMYDQENWFKNICCGNRNFCMFGIVALPPFSEEPLEAPNALIGVCGLTNIHWVLRSAELSFYIGARDLYVDATYAPEAVKILCRYAFKELNMHKVWAEIYAFDQSKTRLFESLGMHRDGVLRDNAFTDGRHHDSLIYSVLASEHAAAATTNWKI